MIQTGKYFEGIVEMLNNFRSEVQIFSSLELLNINKHSENFMKRVFNLTYGYELENLNKEKSNYPGIDLGDIGDSIAYQITATKKSDKIDETLSACLKYKHYETFKTINIFVLTSKQSSYTLKVTTEPHFTFLPEKNIRDFGDLLKDIEHLVPSRMKALYDYIKSEMQQTIEAIRNDKSDDKKQLLDIHNAIAQSGMSRFCHWRSQVSLINSNLAVPDIHSKLNNFFSTSTLKNQLLPVLNSAFRKTNSNKEILYLNEVSGTGITNLLYGQALLIEKSSLTIERVIYTNDKILTNLLPEMLSLLTKILFFSKYSKGVFEIEVAVSIESNIETFFHPTNSLVIDNVFNSYILESPFEMKEILTDIKTSTLADLLQKTIYGFISNQTNFLTNEPFITINRDSTEFVINNIKTSLGIGDSK
jgi:hypothetical protein